MSVVKLDKKLKSRSLDNESMLTNYTICSHCSTRSRDQPCSPTQQVTCRPSSHWENHEHKSRMRSPAAWRYQLLRAQNMTGDPTLCVSEYLTGQIRLSRSRILNVCTEELWIIHSSLAMYRYYKQSTCLSQSNRLKVGLRNYPDNNFND
jgi:hypothetical protein